MADLHKCSKCKSEQELKYFSLNKKGQLYKTCDNCRNHRKLMQEYNKYTFSVHKEVESWYSSDNEEDDARKQCYKQACKEFFHYARKMDLDMDEVINQKCEVQTYADILYNKRATVNEADTSTTAESSSTPDEKYIIVMDVETNGLIKQRGITPTRDNLHMFPNIVQFSWGLFTETGECKVMKDYIIKPDGWTMNGKDAFHGITLEKALKEGVDIKTVLNEYKHDIENCCSKLVCHNLNFDKQVVLSEFIRHGMDLNDVGEYCTMRNTINNCKITPKVRGEYKWPSLEQLYQQCFNEKLQNAHNSYYDVLNCAKCYFAIKDVV